VSDFERPGLVYHKGAQVHCPNCDDHIANFARHIWQGDKFDGNMFEWKNQKIEWGEAALCKKCQAPFFKVTNKRGQGNFMKVKENIS